MYACCRRKRADATHPFFKGYRPQFYFRTTDVTGVAQLPEGMEMVMPGDNVQLEVELITPIAMDKGLRFTRFVKAARTVGARNGLGKLPRIAAFARMNSNQGEASASPDGAIGFVTQV